MGSGNETRRERIARWLGQKWCGLRYGHSLTLHYQDRKVAMRCSSCDYSTPGWVIEGQGPRQRFAGDERRHELRDFQVVRRRA